LLAAIEDVDANHLVSILDGDDTEEDRLQLDREGTFALGSVCPVAFRLVNEPLSLAAVGWRRMGDQSAEAHKEEPADQEFPGFHASPHADAAAPYGGAGLRTGTKTNVAPTARSYTSPSTYLLRSSPGQSKGNVF